MLKSGVAFATILRMVGVLRLGVACLLAVGIAQPVASASKKAEEVETKQVALVQVELKEETGKVLKSKVQLDWGQDGAVELVSADHKHRVPLKVERDGEQVSVTFEIEIDGETIIAPYTFETKAKQREVIQIEGGLAVALKVTPKKVKVDAPPPKETEREETRKLEIEGDENDPLGGLK